MSVVSKWKVVWNPAGINLTIIDDGTELSDEFPIPWEQAHEDRQVVEGTGTEPLPRSLVSGSLTLGWYITHANDITARQYLQTYRSTIAGQRGARASLTVSPVGSGGVSFSNAMIKSYAGRMQIDPAEAKTFHTITFLFPE